MAMRAPRIMQRKRVTPYERSGLPESRPSTSTTATDAIDEVLGSSGVYIQDGVMLRIEDNLMSEERAPPEESDYAVSEQFHANLKDRRITVDDSVGFGENTERYVENRLPGMADDVECYQCRYCTGDKVYLTGIGLEKHTRASHKEHISKVLREIELIEKEWNRRRVEREKIKERRQVMRMRQEALANAAAREMRIGSGRRRWNADGSYTYVIPSEQLDIEAPGNSGVIGSAGGPFEACEICNLQINVSHPTALDTHMRAHNRNFELRDELLSKFGPELVDRLMCHSCQLVFTDEGKLRSHREGVHTKRRKFVCKWCGDVTNSVTELNEHKIDVHAMPPNGGPRQMPMGPSRKEIPSDTKKGIEKNKNIAQNAVHGSVPISRASAPPSSMDESHYSITGTCCPDCSLLFNRPSLLLKHMMRVHSKYSFSAFIETKGLPSFSVQVDRGRVVWSCCGRDFNDRVSFSIHRQSHSIASVSEEELMEGSMGSSSKRQLRVHVMPSPQQEVVISSEDIKGEILDEMEEYSIDQSAIMGADGTIELVGVKPDEGMQYMLVVEQDGNGREKKKIVTYDPRSNPEEMMRQDGMGLGVPVVGSTSREGVIIDGSNYMEDENGQIILSNEQYEHLRSRYGDELPNFQVLFVEDGHGNIIEDDNEEDNEGTGGNDSNALQEDILEPSHS